MNTAPVASLEDYDALVLAIHRGALEAEPWRSFLDALRSKLGVYTTNLSIRSDERHGIGLRTISIDPLTPGAQTVDTGGLHHVFGPPESDKFMSSKVYAVHEYLDPNNPEHKSFIDQVMNPPGFCSLYVARLRTASGANGFLAIGDDNKFLSQKQIFLIERILPHLEISIENLLVFERERSRFSATSAAVRSMNFCWLKLDSNARIIDADPQAWRIFRRCPDLRLAQDGRLILQCKDKQAQLLQVLGDMLSTAKERTKALHLSDQPWLDMLLVPSKNASMIDTIESSITAYIHGEDSEWPSRREQLFELFKLSPKEADLAVALSRGKTIRESAVELGLTENSAREYTRRIYARTGTRNQADLVRLILTSVVSLA